MAFFKKKEIQNSLSSNTNDNDDNNEKIKCLKTWVGKFWVGIFWVVIFRGDGILQGDGGFDGWKFSGWKFSKRGEFS